MSEFPASVEEMVFEIMDKCKLFFIRNSGLICF